MSQSISAKFDASAIIAGVISLLVAMVSSAAVYYITMNDEALARNDGAIVKLKEDVAVVKTIVQEMRDDIQEIKSAITLRRK